MDNIRVKRATVRAFIRVKAIRFLRLNNESISNGRVIRHTKSSNNSTQSKKALSQLLGIG